MAKFKGGNLDLKTGQFVDFSDGFGQVIISYDGTDLYTNQPIKGERAAESFHLVRYDQLTEASGTLQDQIGVFIEENDILVDSDRFTTFNFEGSVSVIDEGSNKATITVSGGGAEGPQGEKGFGVWAWALTDTDGTLLGGYNLSVSRASTGTYNYTFTLQPDDTNYGVHAQPYQTVTDTNAMVSNEAVSGFTITTGQGDNGTSPDTLLDVKHSVVVHYDTSSLSPGVLDMQVYLVTDSTGEQQLLTSAITINFDNENISNSNYSLSNDEITVNTSGYYDVDYFVAWEQIDTTGSTRAAVSLWMEKNDGSWAIIPGSWSRVYQREATDGGGQGTSYPVYLNSGEKLRVRVQMESSPPNVQTLVNQSHVSIKRIDPDSATLSGITITDHGELDGLLDDDHPQYVPTDGSRGFTSTVSGVDPIQGSDLVTLQYLESVLDPTTSGGVGNILFGSEFNYEIDETESSTNATTYQEKLSLNTGDVPEGSYRVGWSFEWRISKQNREFEYRVQLDNTTNLSEQSKSPFVDVNEYNLVTNFYYIETLSSGTHTFDIDYNSNNAGATAYIRNARIEFWRVL